jgi:hypothetical protein
MMRATVTNITEGGTTINHQRGLMKKDDDEEEVEVVVAVEEDS